MKLKYNYHTHTYRCGHALGDDEDYVINAIKSGIKELGFSDHIPFPSFSQPGVRMEYNRLDEYISSINALKEKYQDQIKIYVGFEAEYYHEDDHYYKELLKKVDYLICGQHFSLNRDGTLIYAGYKKDNQEVVTDYVNRVIEAIESGYFKYIAHPDIILNSYTIRDEFIENQMKRICQKAEEYHIPLEINLEGIKKQIKLGILLEDKFYPHIYFWNIAKDYKIDVIIGADIHDPVDFLSDHDRYGYEIASRCKLKLIEKIEIK